MSLIVRIVIWLLKHKNLSLEDGAALTKEIVNVFEGAPIRDIITQDEMGVIYFDGKPLGSVEKAYALRDAARAALDNQALKLVWEQTLYTCFKTGVSEGDSVAKIMFSKTAIWNGENERNLLRILAQEGTVGLE